MYNADEVQHKKDLDQMGEALSYRCPHDKSIHGIVMMGLLERKLAMVTVLPHAFAMIQGYFKGAEKVEVTREMLEENFERHLKTCGTCQKAYGDMEGELVQFKEGKDLGSYQYIRTHLH